MLKSNKVIIWIAAATLAFLAIPLVAMQFSSGVDWDIFDFITMGTLIFVSGSIFVLIVRNLKTTSQKLTTAAIVAFIFVYLWAELAVGIFTNWGS